MAVRTDKALLVVLLCLVGSLASVRTSRSLSLSRRQGWLFGFGAVTYSREAFPNTVEMPSSLIAGWYAARRMANVS